MQNEGIRKVCKMMVLGQLGADNLTLCESISNRRLFRQPVHFLSFKSWHSLGDAEESRRAMNSRRATTLLAERHLTYHVTQPLWESSGHRRLEEIRLCHVCSICSREAVAKKVSTFKIC